MKKTLSFFFMMLLTTTVMAQQEVTKFLGIPIDGFKPQMRQNIIAKGYTPKHDASEEYFEGEFNGEKVHIFIGTNNNKVYRIMVADANTRNEANIKERFNILVKQFEGNTRYMALQDQTIGDDVDIEYEMVVHNKNFDAIFYQLPTGGLESVKEEDIQNKSIETAMRPVWFRIVRHYNEYYITMYYDNMYNQANGEDL